MYDSTLLSNYERVYYITRIFKKQEEKTCECMMPLFKKKSFLLTLYITITCTRKRSDTYFRYTFKNVIYLKVMFTISKLLS